MTREDAHFQMEMIVDETLEKEGKQLIDLIYDIFESEYIPMSKFNELLSMSTCTKSCDGCVHDNNAYEWEQGECVQCSRNYTIFDRYEQ